VQKLTLAVWGRHTRHLSTYLPAHLVIGLLALKKSIVGVLLMIPLIVVTALFNTYMHQQHFRTAEFLPAQIGTMADRKSGPDMDLSFLRDAFVQPELQVKEAFPEVYVEPASLKEKQEI